MEPEKRKALISRLSSPDEEERRLAMEALKDDLSESDLAWLTGPLSDESWRVRKEGIEGLSRLPPTPRFVSSLVPLMDPGMELTLRNSVVEVLERLGHEVAPLLADHLHTDQTDVRKFLVDILGNIANPETVPSLVNLLNDPEDNIRAAAAEALAAMGDPSVCRDLMDAMAGADDWVIYSILGSLARLKCAQALPVFFRYLGNQLLAIPALSGIGAMGSVEDGLKLMEIAPRLTKGAAKTALMASGSIYRRHVSRENMEGALDLRDAVSAVSHEDMVQTLVSQLEVSDDLECRKDILGALGMIGSGRSLEAILDLVEDDVLVWDVDLALLTLGKRDIGLITGLLNHHDPLVRQRGVRTLERLGSVDSIEALYRMLEDESGHVRKDAAGALASLGDTGSIEKLLPVLEDEYGDVAQSAARALVRLGQRSPDHLAARIIPLLGNAPASLYTLLIMILAEVQAPDWEKLCLNAAQSTESEVRAAAVGCLRRSKSSAAIATIINSLADENAQVRAQAAVTLEELKHPEALSPLKAAVHDQDPWVRSAAVSALSAQPEAVPSDFAQLLRGEDLMMQTSALDALGRMAASGNDSALGMLAEHFEAGPLEMRRSICRLLGRIAGKRAFELLLKALEDDDPSMRVFAVHALSQRGESGIPDVLQKAGESDPDKQVREAIRSVLEDRE